MTTNEAFGRVLQRCRAKKNRTQADIAFAAGFDRTYISLLELGKRSPTLDTIMALCGVLDIKPSELLKAVEKLMNSEDDKALS